MDSVAIIFLWRRRPLASYPEEPSNGPQPSPAAGDPGAGPAAARAGRAVSAAGLDKTADQEQIEANWAQRVIWARKDQIKMPLEDVNWAREVLRDPERRPRADAASLNLDTLAGVLRQLAQR